MSKRTVFMTLLCGTDDIPFARLLIESLREFGGAMKDSPFWLFYKEQKVQPGEVFRDLQVDTYPVSIPESIRFYPFGSKVAACAAAEELARQGQVNSLISIDTNCLILNPPVLQDLGDEFDAAFRPVHIRNVGSSLGQPLDVFWQGIYSALGVQELPLSVTSYVDRQPLRAYFNTHSFAFRPSLGLMAQWIDLFQALVTDRDFQARACSDQMYQIFLFQAVLSTLIASSLKPERIRLLPPTYNYPYNLQLQIPQEIRAAAMNDLVSATFEDRPMHPDLIFDIEIREPLRSWLVERLRPN